MSKLRAAFAAMLLVSGTPGIAAPAEPLRLEEAFTRVIETHPELEVLRYTQARYVAEAERAAQTPPLSVGASAENVLGTGVASGVNGAELTVSLASVLERGDKRAARIALAQRRTESVDLLREGKRLDLLAEVARRYLDVAAAQAIAVISREGLAQRIRTVEAAAQRVKAGGSPTSVELAAEAARIRTEGEVQRAQRSHANARRRLALLWGASSADFDAVATDLSGLPPVPDFAGLTRLLERTPELRRFAHEARLREARVELARSARKPDVEWQVGVRRLQSEGDWGLVGSISIPLGSDARAEPEIRAAEAELAAVELEREGQHRALEATLALAWEQLDTSVAEARQIEGALLPQLRRAEQAAERAYRAGALSYLEWAQLQGETISARRARLDAGLTAYRALIELQRLTGEDLLAGGNENEDSAP